MTESKSKTICTLLIKKCIIIGTCIVMSCTPITNENQSENYQNNTNINVTESNNNITKFPITATDTILQTTPSNTIVTKTAESSEPATVIGSAEITFPLFDNYLVEAFVLLENQAGFVNRNFNFVIAREDQIIGPLTYIENNTWNYVLHLPSVAPGEYVLLEKNKDNAGVKIYAIAVQANTIGDTFLNKNEFHGWSTVWTSARIDSENRDEIIGGKLIVWSPDENQYFSKDFGDDNLLFTEDDPIIKIEAGYTIVNLDTTPFSFTKEITSKMDLYEGDVSVNDLSDYSYSEAFNQLWIKASKEYPFTTLKQIDWNKLYDKFEPIIRNAQINNDPTAWYVALKQFSMSIPDGHIGITGNDDGEFQREFGGGIGLGLTELSNGEVIASYVNPSGPASKSGIKEGNIIISYNNSPIKELSKNIIPPTGPFSTDHVLRKEQYRFVTRGRVGKSVKISWINNNGEQKEDLLTLISEIKSLTETSLYADLNRQAPPIEYKILDDNIGYIKIWSLSDDLNLTLRLFRRAITLFIQENTKGIIVDLRQNLGGSPMGTRLASYFVKDSLELIKGYYYSDQLNNFDSHGPPDTIEPDPDLSYSNRIAVLIGPACASACENVAWVLSNLPQTTTFGHNPTNGIMGEVGRGQYKLPNNISFQIPTGMDKDMEGNIIIEGTGVIPDNIIPITTETVLKHEDSILKEAITFLNTSIVANVIPSGPPTILEPQKTLQAAQNNTPILEELANEDLNLALPEPGQTRSYTIEGTKSTSTIWWYAWCAKNKQIAQQNWNNITIDYYLNEIKVTKDNFYQTNGSSNEEHCFYQLANLVDWPRGEHKLITKINITSDINDGQKEYLLGIRNFVYKVYIN